MNRYVKNDKIINATEKAYNLIYKEQGFVPVGTTPVLGTADILSGPDVVETAVTETKITQINDGDDSLFDGAEKIESEEASE